MKKYKMFVAGPVNVSDRVKKSTIYSEIGHRETEFISLFREIKERLLYAFGVENKSDKFGVVVVGGSGTSATETLLSSILHKNKKNLIIINGAFGERIKEICDLYKIKTISLNYGWGGYPNLKEIEKTIKDNNEIESVSVVHMETSTGMLNPINKIGKICKKHNKLFIVDAISSLGGEKLNMNKDNIDYCITNTNKCLGGLPVLGIICFRKSILKKASDISPRSYYLDFFKYIKYAEQNQTPFTPMISMFYMLNQALKELKKEGIERRIERYKINGNTLKNNLNKIGLKFYLKRNKLTLESIQKI